MGSIINIPMFQILGVVLRFFLQTETHRSYVPTKNQGRLPQQPSYWTCAATCLDLIDSFCYMLPGSLTYDSSCRVSLMKQILKNHITPACTNWSIFETTISRWCLDTLSPRSSKVGCKSVKLLGSRPIALNLSNQIRPAYPEILSPRKSCRTVAQVVRNQCHS